MTFKLTTASVVAVLVAAPLLACGDGASATTDRVCNASAPLSTTYQVGPGKAYADLQAVAPLLAAGDVVEVYGKAVAYPGGVVLGKSGTATAKITVRGIRVNGARPILSGGSNTVQFDGSHYVFEGFDVTAGQVRNVFHHADDITIKDTVVHDCVGHGILGADEGAGSLTLDHVEVYGCGSGTQRHPVYMATDETMYPNAVFRMQFSYLHNQNGGNNVKSRAGRNEIYYNWIEGGFYREIELIGPEGQDPALKREDSDVVGNVFVKTQGSNVARIGGDGTGDTSGRYRFVNNTFILQASTTSSAIQVFDQVESVEMHNNVFYRLGGGALSVLNTSSAAWTTGSAVVAGGNNWVPNGTTDLPSSCGATQGSDPGFAAATGRDFRLAAVSALAAKGTLTPASPSGHAFTAPLALPLFAPPVHAVDAAGLAVPRAVAAGPSTSIGAYEVGAQVAPPVPAGGGTGGTGTGGGGGSGSGTGTSTGGDGTGGSGTGTGGGTGGEGSSAAPYGAQLPSDGC